MTPFGFHWLTFGAIVVTVLTVVASILWAIFARTKEDKDVRS